MDKVNNIPNNYKLSVDIYEEQGDTLVCQCFTPGVTGEGSYIEKTVTFDELRQFIGDKVFCTYANDTQDGEPVPFEVWYNNNRYSEEVNDALADIINKREGRKELADMPDIFASLPAILNPFTNKKTA